MEHPTFAHHRFLFYGNPQSTILQSVVTEINKYKGATCILHDCNDNRLDLALQRFKYDVIVVVLDHQSDIDKHIQYNIVKLQEFLDAVERCKRTLWANKLVIIHDVSVCSEITSRMIAAKQTYLPDISLLSVEYESEMDNIVATFKVALVVGFAKTICQPLPPESAENVTDKGPLQANVSERLQVRVRRPQVLEQAQVQLQEQLQEEAPPLRQESEFQLQQ